MLNIQEEAARCLLCESAPCSAVCRNGDPARAVRAIRFGNEKIAAKWLEGCSEEELAKAEEACIHYDRPLHIREMAASLPEQIKLAGPSLEIDFCGIRCENPFFLASSAVCTNYNMVAEAFKAGWAGVFFKTICKQEINEVSPRFDAVRLPGGTFAGFRNMEQLSENRNEEDFDTLRRLKRDFPTKVVVASIMGQYEEDWIDLAKQAEEAGVDAIELNFSCPQMRIAGMGSDVGQNAEMVAFYTAYVKQAVSIPVIPKMTPNVASVNPLALAAHLAGADGISAINTIKSVTMGGEVSGKRTTSGYSGRAVKPIALRFIMEMAQNPVLRNIQLSGIGGIEVWRDALDFIKLGCRNVQVCTSVMEYGHRIIDDLLIGLSSYLAERGVSKLEDIVGEAIGEFVRPADLDRDTVVYPVIDPAKCIGCGRCYLSCRDGGHQAINFAEDRVPHVNGAKCVGCHLCTLVCPVDAISTSKRVPKRH